MDNFETIFADVGNAMTGPPILPPDGYRSVAWERYRHSPTSIATYLSCPRDWFLYYICGVRPKRKGVALNVGSMVHGAFEQWATHRLQGGNRADAYERALAWLNEESSEFMRMNPALSPTEKGQVLQTGLLFDFYVKTVFGNRNEEMVSVEAPSELEAGTWIGLPKGERMVPVFPCIAIPDRVFKLADGSLALGDLKVVSRRPDGGEIRNWRMNPQAMMNVLFYHAVTGEVPEWYRVDYLIKSGRRLTVKDTEQTFLDRVADDFSPEKIEERLHPVQVPIERDNVDRFVRLFKIIDQHISDRAGDDEVPSSFEMNPVSCKKLWGWCRYHPICVNGDADSPLDMLNFSRRKFHD